MGQQHCEECKKATAAALMEHARIFWHYGQIIPSEDRHKLAQLLGQLADFGETERIRNEIVDLLAEHEVQVIFRSKHKEVIYSPECYGGTT